MKNFKLVQVALAGLFYRTWAFHNSPNLPSRSLLKHSLLSRKLYNQR